MSRSTPTHRASTAAALALVGALASGCAAAQGAGGASGEPRPNLSDLKQSIVEYHDSGRWDADIARIDEQARRYLAHRLQQGVPKPAVVLDIDETSLSTYDYEVANDFGYDKAEFDEFVLGRKPTAIGATRDLVRFADEHGVAVFFVTGRRDTAQMRQASAQDLREEGYPEPDGLYLRPVGDHNPSVVPYKSGARADIERQGYRIVLNVGDQQSDLDGGHAERPVKLPNPMYEVG
ncbi:acid phosphatase [Saccharopolyspora subtropica]|uniref:Acid phosphatase n=1 Tax=Saccharopolyspora thermophila TaxID=89367 RepID=A0A917JNM9_9PSEU|nr:HAD family acid phosphatase [Saccharopolyspora subtropica]GGI78108.1 acid phosphatase [Saccharopolyspora subtropica]